MSKKLISREEAMQMAAIDLKTFARLTGLAYITVFRLAQEGHIQTIPIGSRKFVPYWFYAQFIECQEGEVKNEKF